MIANQAGQPWLMVGQNRLPEAMLAAERGKQGEQIALRYLEKQGLTLITRNYRCYHGEIDLVMQEKQTLVFVEVRLRSSTCYGSPLASVTHSKIRRLIKTAEHYLVCQKKSAVATRFDVVGITKNIKISWIRDAFSVEY